MRITLRVYDGSKDILMNAVRKKFTKGDVIKRVMREQKQCFGALLETKKDKIQRLKLRKETRPRDETNIENNTDSEFSWMMKVSEARLRRIGANFDPNAQRESKMAQDKISLVESASKNEKSSSDAIGLDENKSTKKNIAKKSIAREEQIARIVRDARLPRVQTKIVRKSIGLETSIENRSGFVIADKHFMEIPKFRKQRIAAKNEKMRENFSDCAGDKEKSHEGKAPVSPILRSQDQMEKIKDAHLFHDEKEKENGDAWRSSILSVASTKNLEYSGFPSVTKILNSTMSDRARKMLEFWMARMISELGQEGFDEYKRDLLENGKLLHSLIDNALRKLPVEPPVKLKPCFNSIQNLLEEVKDVRAIESHVIHQDLGYRGLLDCVASYRGNLCVIDWKKSDKPKDLLSATYDAPLQLASYIGALNADKNYPFQIKSGLLVIAYTTGNPPTVHQFDEKKLQYYWKHWLERLEKYYTMQNT